MKFEIKELDDVLELKGGEIIVIGGRPYSGKTLLAKNIIIDFLRRK